MDLNPHFEFGPPSSSSSWSPRPPAAKPTSHGTQHQTFSFRASTDSVVSSMDAQDASADGNNPYFEFEPSSSTSSRSWAAPQRRTSAGAHSKTIYNSNAARDRVHPRGSMSPATSRQHGHPRAAPDGWENIERAAGESSTSPTTASPGHDDDKTALGDAISEGAKAGGPRSVCVLDTNTLIDAHGFFEALFSLLFRNISTKAFSTAANPFVIVIPHFVLVELDGLKTNPRVGSRARDANRVLLRAIHEQSRVGRQLHQQGSRGGDSDLPRHLCPLLVERAHEAHARTPAASVDASLVALCHALQRQTGLPVLFCSNDTNARTRAEIEGVPTFDLGGVLRASATVRARRKEEARKVRRMEGDVRDVDRSSGASIWSSSAADGSKRGGEVSEDGYPLEAPEMLLEQWAVQLERGGGGSDEGAGIDGSSVATQANGQGNPPPPPQVRQALAAAAQHDFDDGMDVDGDDQQFPGPHVTQPVPAHDHAQPQEGRKSLRRSRAESPGALLMSNTAAQGAPTWDPELVSNGPQSGTSSSWTVDRSSGRGDAYRSEARTLRSLPTGGARGGGGGGGAGKSSAASAWAAPSAKR